MPVIKIGDLTTFAGDPSGSYLVINDSASLATYKIQREALIGTSFLGTASWSDNALTASYVENSQTASFVTSSNVLGPFGFDSVQSSSYALSASYASNTPSASYAGTASYVLNAISSSLASTASFVNLAQSASYVLNAVSASYAATASWAINSLTASSADSFIVRGGLTGSDALFTGTITAQTLHVQYVTASTGFVTGSSKFGSQLTDTHQFTGSVSVTGSLTVDGTLTATSSYALNALSSSYALTASYVENSQTASFVTGSSVWGPLGSNSVLSASYSVTASYAINSIPPFPYTGSAVITGSLTVTGSMMSSAGFTGSLLGSSSYSLTSSVAGYSRIQESQYRFQNITVIDQDVWLNSGSIVKVVTSSGVSTAEYSLNGGSYSVFSFTGDTWTGNIPVAPKDTFSWRITYRSGFTTAALIVVSNITVS